MEENTRGGHKEQGNEDHTVWAGRVSLRWWALDPNLEERREPAKKFSDKARSPVGAEAKRIAENKDSRAGSRALWAVITT